MTKTRRAGNLVALTGTLAAVTAGHAAFVGIIVDLVDDADDLDTYRVYGFFDDPQDRVLAIDGNDTAGPLRFTSSAPLVNDGGAFSGFIQEDLPAAPISGPRDSWVTIAHDTFKGLDVIFSTGFGGGTGSSSVIKGTRWCENDGGWFDGNPASFANPDEDGLVLLAQFTGPAGFHFTFRGNISWIPGGGGGLVTIPFSHPSEPVPCPGDTDGDGFTGFLDLLEVLATWGTGGCTAADVDASGTVDFGDVLFVLSHWGDCF